ncbi:hypothetical protein KBB89_00075 [Candidatus Gracilibacteria bacterium]|nr:hypothetical protein [Candidatus Gracilibacteria bacterium]
MSEFYSPFETLPGYTPREQKYGVVNPLGEGRLYGEDNHFLGTTEIDSKNAGVILPAWEGVHLILNYPEYRRSGNSEALASVDGVTKFIGVRIAGTLAHIYGKLDPKLSSLKILDDTRGNNTAELSIVASGLILPNGLRVCHFTYPVGKNPYTYALVNEKGDIAPLGKRKYFSQIEIIGDEIIGYDMYENYQNLEYRGLRDGGFRYKIRDDHEIVFHKMKVSQ